MDTESGCADCWSRNLWDCRGEGDNTNSVQSITPLVQKLQDVGVRSYRILEAGSGVGGTWHWNQYPGVACDVPAHAYSFSWRPNPSWSGSFPGAQEIQVSVPVAAPPCDELLTIDCRRTLLTPRTSSVSCPTSPSTPGSGSWRGWRPRPGGGR